MSDQRLRHFGALAAAVVTIFLVFYIPGGILGYLAMVTVSALEIFIGHSAIRFLGKHRWAAIVGLILSYQMLLFDAGLLIIRTARIFAGYETACSLPVRSG